MLKFRFVFRGLTVHQHSAYRNPATIQSPEVVVGRGSNPVHPQGRPGGRVLQPRAARTQTHVRTREHTC